MNDLPPAIAQIFSRPEFFIIVLVWSIFWKGMALWKSARSSQLVWFLILLVVNTLGLLEIAYIFYLNRWDIDGGRFLAFLQKKFPHLQSRKNLV